MSPPAVQEERRYGLPVGTRLGCEAPRTRRRRVGAEIVSMGRPSIGTSIGRAGSGSVLDCAWAIGRISPQRMATRWS
jgi:hypothetical protein